MTHRHLRALAAALTLGVGGALTLPVMTASASADGCVRSELPPNSCVTVVGSSTYVDTAGGGVLLSARQSARGHFQVYSVEARFDFQSPDQTYWNESYYADTFWARPRASATPSRTAR
jgi:hypothetical protein